MFDEHESDLCPVCGYRTNFLRHNQHYTPKERMDDFSATYDGFDIVSLGFRECVEGTVEGVAFDELEVTKDYFNLRPELVVPFDPGRSKTRFFKRCDECGNFESVVGTGRPSYIKVAEPILWGIYRTDLKQQRLSSCTRRTQQNPSKQPPEHPFYFKTQRARDSLPNEDIEGVWKEAGDLELGDRLLTPDGRWKAIAYIENVTRSETVYNFTVSENHNYFVGRRGILAHNIDCTDLAKALRNKFGGGSVVRLKPKGLGDPKKLWLDKPSGLYPDTPPWGYHDVYIKQGMVFDPLSKFGNTPVPFKTWWELWENGTAATINRL